MYYDKRIRYLSYYESGIKVQNAGYVKFQVRDSLCQMVIQVKGPRLMGSGDAAVYLLSGKQNGSGGFSAEGVDRLRKHPLGNLAIHNGQGYCAVRMDAENMADGGLRYGEVCGIRIELREHQYLESRWSAANAMGSCADAPIAASYQYPEAEHVMPEESKPQEISLIVTPVSERSRCVSDDDAEEKGVAFEQRQPVVEASQPMADGAEKANAEIWERTPEKWEAEPPGKETEKREAEMPGREPEKWETGFSDQAVEKRLAEEDSLPEDGLHPDKWEQLRKTYPIVHPIREDEEYLKIEPKDFVIFTEKYQELVHNSFLLHGYYNYRHLIFGKKERDGRAAYYLGVPGTFHDREKSVAVMFGFEAFDGKREPAENGDFGYYLKRVEI